MIDYLELYSQEEADALWEAMHRVKDVSIKRFLEQESLRGGGGENPNEYNESMPLANAIVRYEHLGTNLVELSRKTEGYREKAQAESIRALRGVERGQSLEHTAGMERMQVNHTWENKKSREIGRVEQLDRIFRRDSRRYDGGFFLY